MIRHRDVSYVEFGLEGDCDIKFSDAYRAATLFFCPCPASTPPPPPPPLAIEPHKIGPGSSSGTQTEIRGKYLFYFFLIASIILVLRQNVASHNVSVTKRNCY